MAAAALIDLVCMTVASAPGTGTVTLGTVATATGAGGGVLSMSDAGAVNGTTYRYCLTDGNNRELAQGTYSSSAGTLTRTTLIASVNGVKQTTPIIASSSTIVSSVMLAEDVLQAVNNLSDLTNVATAVSNLGLSGGGGSTYQGPLLPSSIYVGGASGNLSPTYYIPTTNTNAGGAFEGTGVVASLAADAPVVMQFNMPEVLPTGKTLKLRVLAMSPATSGVANLTVQDGATSAGSNIGATTLHSETQVSQTWATADVLVENKVTLTTSPTANQIVTVVVTFNHTSWTLASQSVWQFSLVWE